jgi:hypothetical protein
MRQALGANVMKFSALSLLENRLERLSIYIFFRLVMDKHQLTGRNLGRVFNFRSGHLHAAQFWCYQ